MRDALMWGFGASGATNTKIAGGGLKINEAIVPPVQFVRGRFISRQYWIWPRSRREDPICRRTLCGTSSTERGGIAHVGSTSCAVLSFAVY
jgi:hypothetical protein